MPPSTTDILHFDTLAELRAATGLAQTPPDPDFHVFRYADLAGAKTFMPPYRRGFYQITLLQDFGDSSLTIGGDTLTAIGDTLCFVGPQQILN